MTDTDTTTPNAGPPPSPVQTHFSVRTVPSNEGPAVIVLVVRTPAGQGFYFMDAATAVTLGEGIARVGREVLEAPATEPAP